MVEDDLQKDQKETMNGSFDWIVTSPDFSKWFSTPSNSSLQIIGRPGSGKSTLAAFLVQHLSKSSSVLFFFCNASDGEKRDTIYVLRTLLAQLLKIDSRLVDVILPLYQQSGRTFADSHTIVSEVLSTVLAKHKDHVLYLVVDAIDECTDAWQDWEYKGLLAELQSCTNKTKVKTIITRRDNYNGQSWKATTWSVTHELVMKPKYASPFIQEYLKNRAKRIAPIANTNLEHQIVEEISRSADGLWLYARLMVDDVQRAPSKDIVKQRLMSLPHGLSDLYTQILRSCEARMTEDQRYFATYLYIWLDFNDYMPEFWSDEFDRLSYSMLQLIFRFVERKSLTLWHWRENLELL